MKTLLSFFILLLSFSNIAQTPGFMGKRFVAGYGFYASPGYIGSDGETKVNMLHEGFLEFAVMKKLSVGVSGRFYKAVYANKRDVDVLTGYSSTTRQIDNHPSDVTHISARNYAVYLKKYHRNYLAPWGRYVIFGVTLNQFTSSYDPALMGVRVSSRYMGNESTSIYSDFGPTKQTYTRFDILFGAGRSRVIGKRITLDYGYNLNLIALATTLFDAPDDNIFEDDALDEDDYIMRTSAARIRGVNRFNVFLKVGVLLF